MDQRIIDAIENVVNYLWDDEVADYAEQDGDGQEHHIFNSLELLDDYVKELQGR